MADHMHVQALPSCSHGQGPAIQLITDSLEKLVDKSWAGPVAGHLSNCPTDRPSMAGFGSPTDACVFIPLTQIMPTLPQVPDMEADFGVEVPELGMEGMLKVANPEDACRPFPSKDFKYPWFALISRHQQSPSANCTFDIKVMHAQQAGASAAIVYDDVYESLIIMSKPPGHPDPGIPAVFINLQSSNLLIKLLEVEGDLRVRIMPMSGSDLMTLLASLIMVLMVLASFMASFHFVRLSVDWMNARILRRAGGPNAAAVAAGHGGRLPAETGLPVSILRKLPVIVYERSATCVSRAASGAMAMINTAAKHLLGEDLRGEGGAHGSCGDVESNNAGPPDSPDDKGSESMHRLGDSNSSSEHDWPLPFGAHAGETKRTCAVCLEDYEEGEKVRVLPCQHRFHMQCVDQWLSNRRACPVCKHDASQPLVPERQQEAPEDAAPSGLDFARARRRALIRLAGMRSGLMFWLNPRQDAAPNPAVQPLLGGVRPSARHARRAMRAAAAAARTEIYVDEEAGDIEAGVVEGEAAAASDMLMPPDMGAQQPADVVVDSGSGLPQPVGQQPGSSLPIPVPAPQPVAAVPEDGVAAGGSIFLNEPPTPPSRVEPQGRAGSSGRRM